MILLTVDEIINLHSKLVAKTGCKRRFEISGSSKIYRNASREYIRDI